MAQINPNLTMFFKITTEVQPIPSKPPKKPRKTTTKKQIKANDKNDNQADTENKEISKDPKKGTNQILNSFWDPVANHYATHLPGSCQTLKSLQSRWGDHIQKEVNKFLGCVHQVDNLNPSGKTDSNQLQLVMTMK
ncbi:hypothetical protein Pst134EA_017552 [Puccinia striiformis f. sp. tritici]|uniref:hypothetical protein n=1 Tax=Puccinia striiformis f. sp. tritici TaxID=168172 RepID=UPI002008AFFD|nr:hypothetical protein Pst134EA_017552 [Puccinia striiformis f. sp. tritici]KAH9461245.1 hypothetical protein Pst134EA_017552 [Puccinia striiformis f. sp. tritici]